MKDENKSVIVWLVRCLSQSDVSKLRHFVQIPKTQDLTFFPSRQVITLSIKDKEEIQIFRKIRSLTYSPLL